MLNLDTHILIYALCDSLTPREKRLLRSNHWGISAIVLWELAKLSQLGRVEMDLEDAEVTRVLQSIAIWPLSVETMRAIPTLDFRSDPADEIIAATSVIHRVPLLTRDRKLLGSKLIPLAR